MMMYPKTADSLSLILLARLPFSATQFLRVNKRFNVKHKTAATEDEPYPVMTRGVAVKKVKAARKEDLSQQTKWGEKHIIVSTFPAE